MAEALLISKKDLQEYTSLNANTDVDKVIQFVLIAQNIWIQQYTGTRLLDKIKTDITELKPVVNNPSAEESLNPIVTNNIKENNESGACIAHRLRPGVGQRKGLRHLAIKRY